MKEYEQILTASSLPLIKKKKDAFIRITKKKLDEYRYMNDIEYEYVQDKKSMKWHCIISWDQIYNRPHTPNVYD